MKKLFITFAAILISLFFCTAADIEGYWKGTLGDLELVFTFKVQGNALIGSVFSTVGEIKIENGTIEGDSISFNATVDGITFPHKGVIEGDIIKLQIEDINTGNTSEIVLQRIE